MEVWEYGGLDAVALRGLLVRGEVSAAEVADTAREALTAADVVLNGLAFPLFDSPLASDPAGPLAGVPFLIKDSGPLARGVPFGCGSRALVDVRAEHDSDLMSRFRAAGLATLGVSTVPELCLSYATESVKHGPTRNPWDLQRGVGGSSGGAAALVAAGAVPMAHGNDGAGSIRIPASCCGLVGLKPSRGRTPTGPDQGEASFGMSGDFALTRTVRDTAHLLDALQGPGVGDKYTATPPGRRYVQVLDRPPGRRRVAVSVQSWTGAGVDAEVAAAVESVGATLQQLGHHVEQDNPVIEARDVLASLLAGVAAAAAPMLTAPRPPDPARLEAVSRQVLAETRSMSAVQLMAALDAQNRLSRSVGHFFTTYDLLLTPTLARLPAPHATLRYDQEGATVTGWLSTLLDYAPFPPVFNISGQPAISLPLAHSSGGLPIGVQLAARYGREDLLLQVASQLEQALPWAGRTPAAHIGRTSRPGSAGLREGSA